MEGFPELLNAFGLYLMLTPIPYALAIILIIAFILRVFKFMGLLMRRITHPEDYKKLSNDEKRGELLKSLAEGEKYFIG
jgi:hypothetical protein